MCFVANLILNFVAIDLGYCNKHIFLLHGYYIVCSIGIKQKL
jgi:hypothetical protein